MPLVSAPNRGYADYQRVGNYDSGVLWSINNNALAADVDSGAIDISRYEALGVYISGFSSQILLTITWYIDSAMTQTTGKRQFTADNLIAQATQVRFVNLGSFARIQVHQFGASPWSLNMIATGTNRVAPLEVMPVKATLYNIQGLLIPANSIKALYPTDYYAGPVRFSQNFSGATNQYFIEALDVGGNYDTIESGSLTASQWTAFTTVVPLGAWRIEIQNTTTANQNYYAIMTPSDTGAS